jgi:hypothetical protein
MGVNEYGVPAVTVVGGVPEITGGRLGGSLTVMVNAASEADATLSLTPITMFENVPTFASAGVPLSCPVVVLKFAHAGLFVMLNVSVVPAFASLAVGVNVYCVPTVAAVAGVPLITGVALVTVIVNAASEVVVCPSLTLIVMLACGPVAAVAGVPLSCPVVVLKFAHAGLFAMPNVKVVPESGSLATGVNT